SDELQQPIRYTSPNPLRFYLQKRRQGIPAPMVLVMIMLHFLPRFQAAPPVSDSIKQISGFSPTGFRTFVQRERKELLGGK
ncbi:MAG: NmrA family transcriptional regulator, partial [Hymenobacteraceae bacterium]|nr:NmrA family transcriptional regulator [Hymenobacteraceae bacterium]